MRINVICINVVNIFPCFISESVSAFYFIWCIRFFLKVSFSWKESSSCDNKCKVSSRKSSMKNISFHRFLISSKKRLSGVVIERICQHRNAILPNQTCVQWYMKFELSLVGVLLFVLFCHMRCITCYKSKRGDYFIVNIVFLWTDQSSV